MYEHYSRPLLPKKKYYHRLFRSMILASCILGLSLGIGILGYHFFCHLDFVDSLLNASMILTGMGPVAPITSTSGKLFASFYAIFSGVVFLTSIAFVFTPIAHRFLHRFHLEEEK